MNKTFEEYYYEAYTKPRLEARAAKIAKYTNIVLISIMIGSVVIKSIFELFIR